MAWLVALLSERGNHKHLSKLWLIRRGLVGKDS